MVRNACVPYRGPIVSRHSRLGELGNRDCCSHHLLQPRKVVPQVDEDGELCAVEGGHLPSFAITLATKHEDTSVTRPKSWRSGRAKQGPTKSPLSWKPIDRGQSPLMRARPTGAPPLFRRRRLRRRSLVSRSMPAQTKFGDDRGPGCKQTLKMRLRPHLDTRSGTGGIVSLDPSNCIGSETPARCNHQDIDAGVGP